MTGAGERDGRSDLPSGEARRRQIATRAERSGLRLVPSPDADAAAAGGQTAAEARLLGDYNRYNG